MQPSSSAAESAGGGAAGLVATDDDAARRGLDTAYELGANLFDTADVYGHGHSERLLGEFLRHVPRSAVAVTSKVGYFTGTAAHAYEPLHMRHQLEQTLHNLGTDHLDIYLLHNANFGPEDRYLTGAVETMRTFQAEGLVRAIGMRGPHRYAPDRLVKDALRDDKYVRFRELFEVIRPEVLTVRYNLLTPGRSGSDDIFTFAAHRDAVVLVNKPLGQGLLTGKYNPQQPPVFGDGDHRRRKRWFTPAALTILLDELAPLRERFGAQPRDLIRVALRYCLHARTVLIVGFTRPAQVVENLTCLGEPLTAADVEFIAEVGQRTQRALDAAGEVFLNEVAAESGPAGDAD